MTSVSNGLLSSSCCASAVCCIVASESLDYDQSSWLAYKEVNELFAREVCKVARPGDLIWVHDYHLMLLPEMLRSMLDECNQLSSNQAYDTECTESVPSMGSSIFIQSRIGFFLHTAFPCPSIFELLPCRRELLKGMLASDLIGFHTLEYAKHFIHTCQSTLRRCLIFSLTNGLLARASENFW